MCITTSNRHCIELQARAQGVAQHDRSSGLRTADGSGQAVGDLITYLDLNARRRTDHALAIGHRRCGNRRACIATARRSAARVVGTAAQHRIGHVARGNGRYRGGVAHCIAARRGVGRQGEAQRVARGHSGIRTRHGHRRKRQTGTQGVVQHHRSGSLGVAHHRGQRVGQHVAYRHFGLAHGQYHRLAIDHRRCGNRRACIATARRSAARVVGTAAQHRIGHVARGNGRYRGGVAHCIAARRGVGRQGEAQRVARGHSGIRTRHGHRRKRQTGTQGVVQHHRSGGLGVAHHRGQRVGQHIAYRHFGLAHRQYHRLAIGHRRCGNRCARIATARRSAARIVGTAAQHRIGHVARGNGRYRGGVAHCIAARRGVGRQGEAQRVARGHSGIRTRHGHRSKCQTGTQGVAQHHRCGGL